MLCDWRQSDHGLFPCDDRCKARLLHVKIFGSFDNKLGDAEDSQRRRNRDTIRLYNHDWRPRLRTLLCCYLLRTISSTTTLEATQLGSVWSLLTRNVKCWKSTVRVKPAWMSETVKLRRWTDSHQCHQGRRWHSRYQEKNNDGRFIPQESRQHLEGY